MNHLEKEVELKGTKVFLRVEGDNDVYRFFYSTDNREYEKLADMDVRFLSSETAGGFTGIYLGLFAQSKIENGSFADFDWFEYIPIADNRDESSF